MIFVRSLFDGVIFPDNEVVVIYDEQYDGDEYGNRVDEDAEDRYEFGDIIFESSSMKVVFTGVPSSYLWCDEILKYIQEHINDKNIVIDLNNLWKDWKSGDDYVEFECSELKTIEKKR